MALPGQGLVGIGDLVAKGRRPVLLRWLVLPVLLMLLVLLMLFMMLMLLAVA